jgi:uncharacterized membrane protein YozB (DUF420 family)
MTPTLLAIHPLATTNAVLNAVSTVLLVVGWIAIRQRNWRAHRAAMVAAFLVSTVFLVCYLAYHWIVGHVPFTGQGPVRVVYFVILISHILLAGTVPFLALRMFFLAFRGRLDAHRRLGRIALPIWLYVSVTGVIIYAMLYHLYPQIDVPQSSFPQIQGSGEGTDRITAGVTAGG